MSAVWGALGQAQPSATTLTGCYTVPALKNAAVQVIITNTGAGNATVRLSHAINGAADTLSQYLLYDMSLGIAVSFSTARFAVRAGDVLRVYASTSTVSFNINGIEDDV